MKVSKCSSLAPPRSKFYKTQWAWQGVNLSQLISIFTSKNGWKFWTADKIQSKNYKGVNPPCLMPIRVKTCSNFKSNLFNDFFLIWYTFFVGGLFIKLTVYDMNKKQWISCKIVFCQKVWFNNFHLSLETDK